VFQDELAVKISLDLLKRLWSYGGFKLTGSGYLQIFTALSGETTRHTPSFRGARTCSRSSYHHAKFGGAQISPAAGAAKNVEFFVCMSVRHAFERQSLCARFRHVHALTIAMQHTLRVG